MKTIVIKKSEMINAVAELLRHIGDSDWRLYVWHDGSVEVRHNIESGTGIELINAYTIPVALQGSKHDENYNYFADAEWIVNDNFGVLPEYVGEWNDDIGEYVDVKIILVD